MAAHQKVGDPQPEPVRLQRRRGRQLDQPCRVRQHDRAVPHAKAAAIGARREVSRRLVAVQRDMNASAMATTRIVVGISCRFALHVCGLLRFFLDHHQQRIDLHLRTRAGI